MTFDYPGYELKFIQKRRITDGSAHRFTIYYKFHSPKTGYNYIVTAEYHDEGVFAIKFYCKKDRRSDYKYSKIVNKGDLGNILITCAKVVPILLADYPDASFGFIGSRSVDSKSRTIEDYNANQRFRTYRYIVQEKFGTETFEHIEFPTISGYLLLNRKSFVDSDAKQAAITAMVRNTYVYLPDA